MTFNPKVISAFKTATIEQIDNSWHLETCQMPRKDYEQFAKATASLRGEWVKKPNAHVFAYDPTERIAKMLEAGVIPAVNPFAFFPTPTQEIDEMIEFSGMSDGRWESTRDLRILEPSAGDGRIARMIREHNKTCSIDCYEIDEFNRELLAEQGFDVKGHDFLASPDDGTRYDYIVMNPPFNGTEYQKHVRKAFGLLKRHGVLVSVVPSGFLRDKKFRNFVFEGGSSYSIGSPFETTTVECSVIKMENWDFSAKWEPDNMGFASQYQGSIQIAIDSDALFWSKIPGCRDLSGLVDDTIERLITKEYCSFYCDEKVKQQIMDHLIEDPYVLDSIGIQQLPAKAPAQAQLALF